MSALEKFADEEILGGYRRPDLNVLGPIIAKVLKMPEFEELRDAEPAIHWLMRQDTKIKQGRQILGTCYMPKVNGELNHLFEWLLEMFFGEYPDFLITLDAGYWADATPLQREILVFHELSHAEHAKDENGALKFNKQGQPVFAIVGHDIEEFNQVVARYGMHTDTLEEFIAAAQAGEERVRTGRPLRAV